MPNFCRLGKLFQFQNIKISFGSSTSSGSTSLKNQTISWFMGKFSLRKYAQFLSTRQTFSITKYQNFLWFVHILWINVLNKPSCFVVVKVRNSNCRNRKIKKRGEGMPRNMHHRLENRDTFPIWIVNLGSFWAGVAAEKKNPNCLKVCYFRGHFVMFSWSKFFFFFL